MGNMDGIILGDFLREFFCLDHGIETMNMIVVILSPDEPTPEIVSILNDAYYIRRVKVSLDLMKSTSEAKKHPSTLSKK
jgi:hypothetical protein